jgi:15-cis-phytoene desaturase
MQRYLASMEGAVLSGKLTAQAINQTKYSALSAQLPEENGESEIDSLLLTPDTQQPVLRAQS